MSEKKANSTFIVIHETVLQSWLRDSSSFALFVGLIGIGILADSSAMQWAGFFVAFITCIGRALGSATRMTRDEAIAYLTGHPSQESTGE